MSINRDVFDCYFTDYDESYELYDYRVWAGYSDSAFLFIFEKNGELFTLNGGSNGYGSWDTSFNERARVTESEAQAELDEWDSVFNDHFEG